MQAVVFDRCGEPTDVLTLRELPNPEPGPGEVLVRMLASPINPSDLLYIRGQYGRRPRLPATPGFEGVGIVERAGGGLLGRMRIGRRVAVLAADRGNWSEYTTVSARRVIPLPNGISDEQAATFFVNPASALVMTRHVLAVPAGAWLLQSAAGSALGRMVIRLSRLHGFRTINVVRSRDGAEALRREGGDEIICTAEQSIEDRVHAITGGQGVPFAIDAVGGATGSAIARSLCSGGRLLVYGTLSGEPIQLDPRSLIVGQKRVEGFWLGDWAKQQGILTMLGLFRSIRKLLATGVLSTEVGEVFKMADVASAVRNAEKPGRQGKVLLRIGDAAVSK